MQWATSNCTRARLHTFWPIFPGQIAPFLANISGSNCTLSGHLYVVLSTKLLSNQIGRSAELTDSTTWMTTWKPTNATKIQSNHLGSSALANFTAKKIVTTGKTNEKIVVNYTLDPYFAIRKCKQKINFKSGDGNHL